MRIGFVLKGLQGYYAHVKPFLRYSDGNEFIVFHLDRLYGNTKAYEKVSNNVKFIELTYKFHIRSILQKHSLDYMIFFNPGNLFEQTLILKCKSLGVKTVYFQHGVNPDYEKIGLTRKAVLKRSKFFKRIIKYAFFYINFIITVLLQNKFKYYKYFIKRTFALWNKDTNSIIRNYGSPENHTEISFVYNNSDKNLLQNHLGISVDNIEVMGYPFLEPEKLGQVLELPFILYISSALRTSKVVDITIEEELKFYEELYNVIKSTGVRLVIKLHPLDDKERITSHFEDYKGLSILADYNMANLVKASKIVIGDLSSALFYAVRYYKPIILLTYPFLDKYEFDLTDWDIGIKSNLKNLSKMIQEDEFEKIISIERYHDFLINFLNFSGNSNYEIVFHTLKLKSI